jgi:hypothetical protein
MSDEKKTKSTTILLSPSEHEQLRREAFETQESMSALVRKALRSAGVIGGDDASKQ